MLLLVVRLFYIALVLGFTWPVVKNVTDKGNTLYAVLTLLVPVGLAVIMVLLDVFWRKKQLQAMGGLFFGLLAGLAVAYVLGQTVDLVSHVYISDAGSPGIGTNPTAGSPNVSPLAVAPPAPTPRVVTPPAASSPAIAETPPTRPSLPAVGRRIEASQDEPRFRFDEKDRESLLGLLKAFLGASAVYLCVSFILQTKDDFRFVIPYVEFSKQTKGARPILLDTSVIIDGRIADIAETRILESELVVPRFILSELQTVSDSDDKLKRNRGRRGLDILNKLRNNPKVSIRILDSQVAEVEKAPDADAKLVALAGHLDGRIVTNDYNLNKIAQLRGVDVININDLANALKPVVLPGEAMTVKIIKPGEESGQGVGYLEDGTMVVAEGGRENIGKDIAITVTSVLQTSAGRMIFGRVDGANGVRRDRR